jgi:hypothetical protein
VHRWFNERNNLFNRFEFQNSSPCCYATFSMDVILTINGGSSALTADLPYIPNRVADAPLY